MRVYCRRRWVFGGEKEKCGGSVGSVVFGNSGTRLETERIKDI